MNKRIIGVIIIVLSFIFLFVTMGSVNILNKNKISEENARTTDAKIINLSEVETRKDSGRRQLTKLYYEIYLQCTYNVNGIQYTNTDSYRMSDKTELMNKFKLGDTIQITYDCTNPNKMVIGEVSYNSLSIQSIIGFIIIFITGLVFALNKEEEASKIFEKYSEENPKHKLSKKSKYSLIGLIFLLFVIIYEYSVNKIYETSNDFSYGNTSFIFLIIGGIFVVYYLYNYIKAKDIVDKKAQLKVLQIDIIDYERERVFFVGNENMMYFYETDFGESFKTNEIYEVDLTPNNQKSTRIDFQEQNIGAIKIVNIEKSTFKLLQIDVGGK